MTRARIRKARQYIDSCQHTSMLLITKGNES